MMFQPRTLSGNVATFLGALGQFESGGRYGIGPNSSNAAGAYQMTPGFLDHYAAGAGYPGATIYSIQNDPAAQDAIASYAAGQMYNNGNYPGGNFPNATGNWGYVANGWLTGSPYNSSSADANGTTGPIYQRQINANLAQNGTSLNTLGAPDGSGGSPVTGGGSGDFANNPEGDTPQNSVITDEQAASTNDPYVLNAYAEQQGYGNAYADTGAPITDMGGGNLTPQEIQGQQSLNDALAAGNAGATPNTGSASITDMGVGTPSTLPGPLGQILGGLGKGGFAPTMSGFDSASNVTGSSVGDTGGGVPVDITDPSKIASQAGTSVQKGAQQLGGDIQKSGSQLDTTLNQDTAQITQEGTALGNFVGQLTQNPDSGLLPRIGLGLAAVVLMGMALWMFGKEQGTPA
jgi:hypothetical protein